MPQGPLSGITIVDLSRILAGPYCTLLLAELGARVIKVEVPKTGDDARQYGPFKGGKSTYFASVNRGKESIALDLKAAADREIFERLLDKADAVVENFRPGTMEKLGYGWEALHPRYPRLVYAAASGFGHTGPYSHHPSYDMVVQGLGGIMSITGVPDGPLVRVGTSIGDLAGGLYTAVALNAALMHRERTGEATKIDVALLEKAGLPCGPVNNVEQALAHPQTEARNMLVEVDDPVTGPLKLAGNPMKFSAFADPSSREPAPELDADRQKILRELGL